MNKFKTIAIIVFAVAVFSAYLYENIWSFGCLIAGAVIGFLVYSPKKK